MNRRDPLRICTEVAASNLPAFRAKPHRRASGDLGRYHRNVRKRLTNPGATTWKLEILLQRSIRKP
jgi:hypothetical protein